jgi:hypothetical protein
MSWQQRNTGIGALCALLAIGTTLHAQARFEAMTRDAVAAVPGLEVVTIRDNAVNNCYTLFVIHPVRPAQNLDQVEPMSVEGAAAQRDHRLSELSAEFENALWAALPGTLGPDSLKYQWEGQKAQSEFERVLRETELAKLEAWLRPIADAPRLAVAGPGPCRTPTPPSPQHDK